LSRERKKFNSLFRCGSRFFLSLSLSVVASSRCKAMLHHYTEFLEEAEIAEAEESVASVIDDYLQIDSGRWRCNRELEDNEILRKKLFPDF
jgi:hypothetical protein